MHKRPANYPATGGLYPPGGGLIQPHDDTSIETSNWNFKQIVKLPLHRRMFRPRAMNVPSDDPTLLVGSYLKQKKEYVAYSLDSLLEAVEVEMPSSVTRGLKVK